MYYLNKENNDNFHINPNFKRQHNSIHPQSSVTVANTSLDKQTEKRQCLETIFCYFICELGILSLGTSFCSLLWVSHSRLGVQSTSDSRCKQTRWCASFLLCLEKKVTGFDLSIHSSVIVNKQFDSCVYCAKIELQLPVWLFCIRKHNAVQTHFKVSRCSLANSYWSNWKQVTCVGFELIDTWRLPLWWGLKRVHVFSATKIMTAFSVTRHGRCQVVMPCIRTCSDEILLSFLSDVLSDLLTARCVFQLCVYK